MLFSMFSNLWESRNRTKDTKGLGRSRLFFNSQPWPIYIAREGERIDFAGIMELKSDMETDQHFRNLGDISRRDNRFELIASKITKYHEKDTKGLH